MFQEYVNPTGANAGNRTSPVRIWASHKLIVLANVAPFCPAELSMSLAAFPNVSAWHRQAGGGQSD